MLKVSSIHTCIPFKLPIAALNKEAVFGHTEPSLIYKSILLNFLTILFQISIAVYVE